MKFKRVLVTGGSGFIGTYVVEKLLDYDITPVIFDHAKNKNINSRAEIFVGDIKSATDVSEAVAITDGVIHLAGVLGTSETIENPTPAAETNIFGGLNVFKACRLYDKKCTYISVGNYWMNNSYSITKDTVERFAWMFNRELGTKISVVRALNAYGPRQKADPVRKIIPNFIIPALKGDELIVYGDGSQIMDMVFVDDVADVLVRSLLVDHGQYVYNPLEGENKAPKFDIGTGRLTTVQEIAQMVVDKVGSGKIVNVPMRKGEPDKSIVVGNPETLKPLYEGKLPKLMDLETGIDISIEWYKAKLK